MKKILLLSSMIALTMILLGCSLLTTTTLTTTNTQITSSSTTQTTSSASTTSSTTTTYLERFQTIEIYSINDYHGGAYSSVSILAKIGDFLKYKKDTTDHTIIIANGDIFQGSAFSNYYHGRPIVEIFNNIGFDAFVIGNHEFDWGIDKIANYNDGDLTNGEADFPFLAANIVSTSNEAMMPWTEPYKIVTINGLKVGIIGVIGDVINSISASRVEGYVFQNVVNSIGEYANHLRTNENVEVVIAAVHEYDEATNLAIARLTGSQRIDAVFNGHTHQNQASYIGENRGRLGAAMPHAQASSFSDSLLAKIVLIYDRETKTVLTSQSSTLSESNLSSIDSDIMDIINDYANRTDYIVFVNEQLAITKYSFGKTALAPWGSSVIRDYVGVDFGFVNAGGFRVTMDVGVLTMGEMVEIYPFDNYIKTSQVTGSQLHDFCAYMILKSPDIVLDDQASCSDGKFYKNSVELNASTLYTIAAVDYIFDKTNYIFLKGVNITLTEYLMRDLLVMDLRNNDALYFNPSDGTSYRATPVMVKIPFFQPVSLSYYYQDIQRPVA
jgi:2',3'-cyclic-nucleotide 2'-phosphodiesterase (5'-nucleotidase family)